MKHRLRQLDSLLHLAGLREDLARLGLARAAAALADRQRDLADCETRARNLAQAQAERRQILREPMLGSPQLRGSLTALLTTFEADRTREAEAQAAIATAQAACDKAAQALDQARQALAGAARLTEKRRRMRAPLLDAIHREAERRDEAEIEALRTVPSVAGHDILPDMGVS